MAGTADYDPMHRVHATIGRLCDRALPWQLPPPTVVEVALDERRISLRMRSRADVDAWTQHLGMPPGRDASGMCYASVDFAPEGGRLWHGAAVVTISCPNRAVESGRRNESWG